LSNFTLSCLNSMERIKEELFCAGGWARRGLESVHRGVTTTTNRSMVHGFKWKRETQPATAALFFLLFFLSLLFCLQPMLANKTLNQGRFELAAALNLLLWLSLGTKKAHAHLPRHVHIRSAEQSRAEAEQEGQKCHLAPSCHVTHSKVLPMWHLESYIMNEHWEESSK
jgi:hypothetical protein